MLPLAWPSPILIAPNKADWYVDVPIYLSGGFPACGVAQKADERAIVASPITHLIHFLQQFRRDAFCICHSALENSLHNDEISQPHEGFSDKRDV